jgi:hypothetical protein
VIITGGQPQHISSAEAHTWMRVQLAGLREVPGVESVVLTRVQASASHPRPWAWLCELHVAAGVDARSCAEHPVCTEWLMDLRLLGLRPTLAVLDAGEQVI